MNAADTWPWLTIAALGLFHGFNPAMGWLFAVALGLHHQSRRVLFLSLAPIAFGHVLAVAAMVATVVALGFAFDAAKVRLAAGAVLIAWAAWHVLRGHRQAVRIGMRTGLGGLALWSFAVSATHGAGLMLVPVLAPICFGTSPEPALAASSAVATAVGAVSMHTAAMLAATALTATLVYEWAGLAFLRWAWVNVDLIWSGALAAGGAVLIVA